MNIYTLKCFVFVLILVEFGLPSFCVGQVVSYNIGHLMEAFVKNVRDSDHLNEVAVYLKNSSLFQDTPEKAIKSVEFSLFHEYHDYLNDTCFHDLLYVLQNLKPKDKDPKNEWALRMLDSYGKPASGILDGNFKWLGDFNECRNISVSKQNFSHVGELNGKYCSLIVDIYDNAFIALNIGVCLPDSCDPSDLNFNFTKFVNILKNVPALKKIMSVANSTSLSCKPNSRQLTKAGLATICVLSVFIILAMIGSSITVFKYFVRCYIVSIKRHKISSCNNSSHENSLDSEIEDDFDDVVLIKQYSPNKFHDFIQNSEAFFNCFCIFTNGSKVLNCVSTEGQLLSLHGIRFLSLTWVIVSHTYVYSFTSIRNPKSAVDVIHNWEFQVILNGFYSVDSFFVLSGFLLSYLYFEASSQNKKMSWWYFYVHRYLRLTPVYILVVAFYTTLSSYMGSGPLWPDYDTEPLCQKYWWWNILYINNFLSAADQCMTWSWYLANDMQFFVISPLILIALRRWPKVGYSTLFGLLLASCTSGFIITYYYNLPSGSGNVVKITQDPNFLTRWMEYFDKIYIKPYIRIGPYLIGIALGHFLSTRKFSNLRLCKVSLFFGWTFATAVGLFLIYGSYDEVPDLITASFYNAFSRSAFAMCLSWVIFVCLSEQGGLVDKILSYQLFIPLSRLSYCAYLIHPIVIVGYFSAQKTTFDFCHSTMVVVFLGTILVTYALSLFVSLLFESPVIRIEKLIREKFK